MLVVPRLDGKYAVVGTVAILDQVGRLPTGEPGALLRGTTRARVGHGVTGPGAALWVEATPVDPAPVTEQARGTRHAPTLTGPARRWQGVGPLGGRGLPSGPGTVLPGGVAGHGRYG